MLKSVKTVDLQAGMRVTKDVVGKKGDVKVRSGEVLSDLHVKKMQKWKGLDDANPKGIEVENAVGHTGKETPDVVDSPWLSPMVARHSKQKLQSSMQVSVDIDKNGNVVREENVKNESENISPKRGRGRPRKA